MLKIFYRIPVILGALVVSIGMISAPASATTCGAVDYFGTQGGMFLGTPEGCGVGNDKGAQGYGTLNGWTLGESVGENPEGDGKIDLTVTGQDWSITNTGGFKHLALAIKQAKSYAFFVLDLNKALSGTWGTEGPASTINGFSHISAWYKGDGTPPPPPPPSNVPLPAAAWMLLAALGSLVVFRKKSA
ncbi:VPLPA-CTERM sorting domain-containing protein [Roseovarius phycicola]|uniref:VPLPA-CTERM sorting domain-containing protein n=1 Tax=Roseovarius phycicola TaxID=3080976 RepID=A0ABZ2HN61_9RHOB